MADILSYPSKVIIDGEEFTPWLRLPSHWSSDKRPADCFVLKNKNGVSVRICWAPDEALTKRGVRQGSLDVYHNGSEYRFIYKNK